MPVYRWGWGSRGLAVLLLLAVLLVQVIMVVVQLLLWLLAVLRLTVLGDIRLGPAVLVAL